MKTKLTLISVPAVILLCGMTFANAETASKTSTAKGGEAVMVAEEVSAKVTDINYKTREVTLQTKDGEKEKVVAGENIKNFDQIKKGDTIVADYQEAIVYEISKGGKAAPVSETTEAQTARPGSMPGGVAERQVTAAVVVSAINKAEKTITFKNAEGKTDTIKVAHPEKLEGVKVGDRIDITYTQALALSVERKSKQ